MAIIKKAGSIEVSSWPFEQSIPGIASKILSVYSDTLWPKSVDLSTDINKAFFFKTPSGGSYVQSETGNVDFTNIKASEEPYYLNSDSVLSCVGWYLDDTNKNLFAVIFSKSTSASEASFDLIKYNIATGVVSSKINLSRSTSFSGLSIYPTENSMAYYNGDVYFIYHDFGAANGYLAKCPTTGAPSVTDITSFVAAKSGYDTIGMKNIKIVDDQIFLVGISIDSSVTAANTFSFIYHNAIASLPASVNVDTSARIWVSDDYVPTSVGVVVLGSIVAEKTPLTTDYSYRGAIFGWYVIGVTSQNFCFTFNIDRSDGTLDAGILTAIGSGTETPHQAEMVRAALPGESRIYLSDSYSGTNVKLKKFSIKQMAIAASGNYLYSTQAVGSPIASEAQESRVFSFEISFYFTGVYASKNIAKFYLGTDSAAGVQTVDLSLDSSGELVLSLSDFDATPALVTAATTVSAGLSTVFGRSTTFKIERDNDFNWSAWLNGEQISLTLGDAKNYLFNPGNFLTIDYSASYVTGVENIILTVDGVEYYRGTPGPGMQFGGVSDNLTINNFAKEDFDYYYEYNGPCGGFEIYSPSSYIDRIFFANNTASDTRISSIDFDYSIGDVITVHGGRSGGAAIAKALAPVYSALENKLYPIYSASEDGSGASDVIIFFTRMSHRCSFEVNAANIEFAFNTSNSSIVAGTLQSDTVIMNDPESIESGSLGLTGYPFSITLSSVPYALVLTGESHVDFLRKAANPTLVSVTAYELWRGDIATRYSYNDITGTFYADTAGLYQVSSGIERYLQDASDDFSAYIDSANISNISEEIIQSAVRIFLKLGVSLVNADVSWTSDTNYDQNTDKQFFNCGEDVETGIFSTAGSNVYYAGRKQIDVKETTIDQRYARSFKVRIAANLTDADGVTKRYDDFKVFNIMITPESGMFIGGDTNG